MASAGMNSYFHIPQTQPLKNIVHSFWQTQRLAHYQTETIIPKGVIEIIFDFSEEPVHGSLNNVAYRLARCFINGFNTRPITVQLPQTQNFFGVRFNPLAVKTIFGIPAGEFANITVDLALVDNSINTIWHQLFEQETFPKKMEAFSAWLQHRWAPLNSRDELFNRFLDDTHSVIPSVPQLAALLCYSPRQLSRKMYALTGMNTEDTLLYKKYLLSMQLMHTSNMSLTQVAYECRFADQSHFIKTFKSFAGLTPGEYVAAKSHLPGHLYQDVR